MTAPRTITIDGEELVALTRADYEALLARAGDEAAEDAMTRRIVANAATEEAFPASLFEAIEGGANPIKVFRAYRKLTQVELATVAGLGQGYVSGLESGARAGTPATLLKIARSLEVPLELLIDETAADPPRLIEAADVAEEIVSSNHSTRPEIARRQR